MGSQESSVSAFDRLLDRIASVCLTLSGTALVLLIAIFGWLVFGRYVLNSTPTWAEQLGLLLIAGLSFIGAAVGVHEGRHLSVEFIRDALPLKVRVWVHVVADVLLLAFAVLMAWQGYKLGMSNIRREIPLLGISEAWRIFPFAISGVLIVLFTSTRIIRNVRVGLGLRAPDRRLLLESEI
jgi:TRAP-type C4-dicarboxylate transport system permease small subunit